MSVAICVPSRDQVHVGFAKCLSNLTSRLTRCDIKHELMITIGSVLPQQRTSLAKDAIRRGYEYILWLDSDMHFPDHTFEHLVCHKKAIVAATYSTRHKPQRSIAFKDVNDIDKRVANGTGLEKVFAVGMGCMLVHRSVYEHLPEPWFSHLWNEDEKTFSGEDIYFCNLANENNINVYVDLDLSRELAHYGTKAFLLQETQDF